MKGDEMRENRSLVDIVFNRNGINRHASFVNQGAPLEFFEREYGAIFGACQVVVYDGTHHHMVRSPEEMYHWCRGAGTFRATIEVFTLGSFALKQYGEAMGLIVPHE